MGNQVEQQRRREQQARLVTCFPFFSSCFLPFGSPRRSWHRHERQHRLLRQRWSEVGQQHQPDRLKIRDGSNQWRIDKFRDRDHNQRPRVSLPVVTSNNRNCAVNQFDVLNSGEICFHRQRPGQFVGIILLRICITSIDIAEIFQDDIGKHYLKLLRAFARNRSNGAQTVRTPIPLLNEASQPFGQFIRDNPLDISSSWIDADEPFCQHITRWSSQLNQAKAKCGNSSPLWWIRRWNSGPFLSLLINGSKRSSQP
jgi:hypothetical protein